MNININSLVKYNYRGSLSSGNGSSTIIAGFIWSSVRGSAPPRVTANQTRIVYTHILKIMGKSSVNGTVKALIKVMTLLLCYHILSDNDKNDTVRQQYIEDKNEKDPKKKYLLE